jgi:hypothetical protein
LRTTLNACQAGFWGSDITICSVGSSFSDLANYQLLIAALLLRMISRRHIRNKLGARKRAWRVRPMEEMTQVQNR